MSRETWALIKQDKNFNVNVFRRGIIALIVSLGLTCIIVLLMFYTYIREPEPDYYATNGITPPVMLHSMAAANESSTWLLPPDPPNDNSEREIPQ